MPKGVHGFFIVKAAGAYVKVTPPSQVSIVGALKGATRFDTLGQAGAAASALNLPGTYKIVDATIWDEPQPDPPGEPIKTREQIIEEAKALSKPSRDKSIALLKDKQKRRLKYGGGSVLVKPDTQNPPATPPASPSSPLSSTVAPLFKAPPQTTEATTK
jgi:hypothetical protein